MQNGRHAEQVVGHVEVPVGLQIFKAYQPGSFAVARHIRSLVWDAQSSEIHTVDAAKVAGCDIPCHGVVAEVGQGMAQGGEFPIEHGDHARLRRVENQVVEPEIAVHDTRHALGARHCRNMGGQPCHQAVHLHDGLCHRGRVLLAPTTDLPLEIIAGAAVVGQPVFGVRDAVQAADYAVHLVVNSSAFLRRTVGQRLVPKDPALHELHDIKGASDDRFVFAQGAHAGNRNLRAMQALHDLEFPLNRVGRRQQQRLGCRFAAQHVGRAGCGQFVGRIGLPAFEGLQRQRPGKPFDVARQPVT